MQGENNGSEPASKQLAWSHAVMEKNRKEWSKTFSNGINVELRRISPAMKLTSPA
jgi:hypothetical protein